MSNLQIKKFQYFYTINTNTILILKLKISMKKFQPLTILYFLKLIKVWFEILACRMSL